MFRSCIYSNSCFDGLLFFVTFREDRMCFSVLGDLFEQEKTKTDQRIRITRRCKNEIKRSLGNVPIRRIWRIYCESTEEFTSGI